MSGVYLRSHGKVVGLLSDCEQINSTHRAQTCLQEAGFSPPAQAQRSLQRAFDFITFILLPINFLLEATRSILNEEIEIPGLGRISCQQQSAACKFEMLGPCDRTRKLITVGKQLGLRISQILAMRENFKEILPVEGVCMEDRSQRYMKRVSFTIVSAIIRSSLWCAGFGTQFGSSWYVR